jgi:hypothetical protein
MQFAQSLAPTLRTLCAGSVPKLGNFPASGRSGCGMAADWPTSHVTHSPINGPVNPTGGAYLFTPSQTFAPSSTDRSFKGFDIGKAQVGTSNLDD